jgi:hypothetical protein
MAHIDGWAILLERALDDLDRAHDARAKAAGLRKINVYGTPTTQVAPNSSSVSPFSWANCNIRTTPVSASGPASGAWRHGALCQNGLCVKKPAARKGASQDDPAQGKRINWYYSTYSCEIAADLASLTPQQFVTLPPASFGYISLPGAIFGMFSAACWRH